jgi:hypothetical protein
LRSFTISFSSLPHYFFAARGRGAFGGFFAGGGCSIFFAGGGLPIFFTGGDLSIFFTVGSVSTFLLAETSVSLKRGNEQKELGVFRRIKPSAAPSKGKEPGAPPQYSLIGVIQAKGKSTAMFKDDTGTVFTAARGEVLADGFMISGIDSVSVELTRGDKKKKLEIFNPSAKQEEPSASKKVETEPTVKKMERPPPAKKMEQPPPAKKPSKAPRPPAAKK